MFFKLKNILLITLSLMLIGCGDLISTKVVKRQLDGSQFEVQCELDVNKFSEIMNENISSSIRCLGENLNLFIRIVKSEKPGYLSRVQLEQYLAKHRPDVGPEVVKALKSIFDLGYLITGEDPDFISKETINKVINFALVFNQEAALNFGPIFQNESPVTYALHQNHRDRVSAANKAIVQALRTIFNPNRNGEVHKINIISLMESFSTESNREYIEKVKKILFVKKVLFGGEEEILTHTELERIILNFDQLVLITLDAIRYKYIILRQESILQLLKRDVNDLYDIINLGSLANRDEEVLFTIQQAIDAVKEFVEVDVFDVEKFKELIVEGKKIVMQGDGIVVKGKELKNLFNHGKSILQTGTVFHRIYDKFKAQLDSIKPVEETINFDEYRHTYPEHQAELDQFERITKKYRFIKGEFLSGYYIRGTKRNADGIFEIALYEYGIKLLLETFGTKSPNNTVGGYSIDKDQMQKVFKKFENELIDLDFILPQKAISSADNVSLLGTLFQYQSDKNKVLDVNEATEFGLSLVSALEMAEELHAFYKEQNCQFDEFDRVEPGCFKKHFWRGFCTYYKSYYPLMFESMNFAKNCEEHKETQSDALFLSKAISAARSCNFYSNTSKEEIPYSESDIMTIILALTHAETTILRWDTNKNNFMDASEVNKAYEIYGPALDGFLEDKPAMIKKFKKEIYQYLVKYEKIPNEKDAGSILHFIKFLMSFKKEAPAYRKTILSVLGVIGDETEKLQIGPKFDCNLLKDPLNIPREVPATLLKKEEDPGVDYSYLLEPYIPENR